MEDTFKVPELSSFKPKRVSTSAPPSTASSEEDNGTQSGMPPPLTTPSPSSSEEQSKPEDNEGDKRSDSKPKEKTRAERQAKYAEILRALKYSSPEGSASYADSRYSLEVLKGGAILETVKFSKMDNKAFYVFGRVPGCDVLAEHPTVSRTHAILHFFHCPEGDKLKTPGKVGRGEEGFPDKSGLYIFDLNSTHGTFINKNQIFPKRYYRLRVGHVLKFGNSTRLYIVCGPPEDEEVEDEKTVTELQTERLKRELEKKKLDSEGILIKMNEGGDDEEGCGWGMADDAEENSDLRENPFAINFEETDSFDKPQKTLRSWFDREGQNLVIDCREKATGHFICRINLPVDGPGGQAVFAEVEHKGKKKDAIHQATLQACQILDKYGVLRATQHESKRKRQERDWADQDYYSSDEDTFLDRTGSVEQKRKKRMQLAGKASETVETFDSLQEKANGLEAEIDVIKTKIAAAQSIGDNEDVDVDEYMNYLKTGETDVKKLKTRLRILGDEMKKVKKLLDIVRPAALHLGGGRANNDDSANKSSVIVPPSPNVEQKEKEKSAVVRDMKMATPVVRKEPQSSEPSLTRKPQPTLKSPEKVKARPHPNPPNLLKPKPASASRCKYHENSDSSDSDDEAPIESKTKKPSFPLKGILEKKEAEYDYDNSDIKFSTWVPPANQKGDGKTALNEKFGY